MIRKSEYHYGRRVFGNNNKLNPLVGKSPASAGIPTQTTPAQTNNVAGMNSQTLLKGSGYSNKNQDNPYRQPISSKQVEPLAKEEIIVIHVCDEKKKVEKDFKCKKNILLNEMKYFEKHLKMTDSADDIDISVHWDIKIFEWLMKYLNDQKPNLEVNTVIPILISADFLVMARLIDDWVDFVVKNI